MTSAEQHRRQHDTTAERRSSSAATQYRRGSGDNTVSHDGGHHRAGPVASLAQSESAAAGKPAEESSSIFEMSLPVTTFRLEEMVYRGEGNANIVIALPQERKVIRFRKSPPGEVSPDGGELRALRELGFARSVVSRFFGPYVHIPEIVRYDATDIARLSDAIRHRRPEERLHKEITDTCAMKFPDYAFLNSRLQFDESFFRGRSSFCVEIKPKQGYLQQAEQQIPRCPYCLIQYAKLRRKSVSARSNYCPFDLFSGVETRMKAAVEELLKSPQNNLKIFRDGLVVYDQESQPGDLEDVLSQWFGQSATPCRNIDEFCNLMYSALTQPLAQEQLKSLFATTHPVRRLLLPTNQVPTFCAEPSAVARAERCLRLAGKVCNFDSDGLPTGSVLERVWNIQRLSYTNTNYIHSIYSKFAPLLTDDMIYSDLTKLHDCYLSANVPRRVLSDGHTNAVVQKTQPTRGVYFQRLFKSAIETKYDGDLNGNCGATCSKRILPVNSDKTFVNGGFVSQTGINPNSDSQQSFYGSNESPYQMADNEGDQRKANASITAEHLLALQNYLLFAAVRDCSILMTFRELEPENAWRVPTENTIKLSEQLCFLSSVRVSDLDPKSVHSIEKHRQRDVDIFDAVISLLEEEEDISFKNR
ncbi:inositol-pentakisphosphate 2-kinase isoform X2 [Harpegnathos saltator]|uniref:inositol-pentakisphosphate 2-kinase isoform X2 n=1 Tax=Harpegnathos saltator TaxID=610380 RepID=UPI000948F5E8|nr:inositol-pentakisphosphate 2-kinase isoform X2 [Harpegnathos saltator]